MLPCLIGKKIPTKVLILKIDIQQWIKQVVLVKTINFTFLESLRIQKKIEYK